MRRALIAALIGVAVLGCAAKGPGPVVKVEEDSQAQWSYGIGPNGEHCLFYADGSGQTQTIAMSCDSVNYPTTVIATPKP